MKLSIITVNYNNPIGLEETIKSVVNQTNKDFEYIVVDGASTNGDIDIIRKYSTDITKWVSEPDTGIYNAMNKGVRMASGDYLLFMNSGDTMYSNETVDNIYKAEFHEDFIEGIIAFKNSSRLHYPPTKINLSYYLFVTNNYHQASLIKRSMLLATPYDESYRIAADLKFNMQSIICNNCTYRAINVIISTYEGQGVSMTVNHDDERERIFEELIPKRILADYEYIHFIKFWPISRLWPYIYKLGHNKKLFKLRLKIKSFLGKDNPEVELLYLRKLELHNSKDI